MTSTKEASIGQVHSRLRAERGPARSHLCTCGAQAAEWAYQHTAEVELRSPKGSPYSEDLKDYAPLCRRCHRQLDADSYRANGRERGLYAGALLATRVASDPDYAAEVTQHLGVHLEKMKSDPAYRARYKIYMRRTNFKRYRCDECGYENNAGNLGWHRKKTGHEHRSEVVSDVQ